MTNSDPGQLVQTFPRTISLQNWPFLILLCLLGGCPAGLMAVGGNAVGGLLVLLLILSIPALVLTGPYFLERSGLTMRVISLHDNGLCVSTGGRKVFSPWSSLQMVKDYEKTGRGIRQRVQNLRPSDGEKLIVLQSGIHGAGALDFVAAHLAPVARGEQTSGDDANVYARRDSFMRVRLRTLSS